jgi:hypothetical protein
MPVDTLHSMRELDQRQPAEVEFDEQLATIRRGGSVPC